MNDKNKMFCFQCEQTAGCSGCTGNAGVCGKTSSVSALQDELTGALIGLARACRDVPVTGRTSRIILEGLFTTVTNVSFDGYRKKKPPLCRTAGAAAPPAAKIMITAWPDCGTGTRTSAP